jgi:peptide/nickel transport system permease protein
LLGSDQLSITQYLVGANQPPSGNHWIGTDALGRDVWSRTLVGGRVTLLVALVSVLVATVIGGTVGALAGYYRRLDFPIMRLVDTVMSFPGMVLLLISIALVGPGLINVIVIIGLITWTVPCRIVRGQFLQLREMDFVTAARTVGVSDLSIVFRHIVPNALGPLIVYVTLGVAQNAIAEAGISYLGLGVQPPTPSWGNMLNAARSITVLSERPWLWLPPAIMVILFVLSVNFVGDGLRDALDPRDRR